MIGNNTMSIKVTKRDGTSQEFDLEKVHKVLEWAIEGIAGVSMSEIELKANIQLYDKIPAYDIHELLIKSAAELISEHTPNYQFVAARLISYKLRKEAYGQYKPLPLVDIIKRNINLGVYDNAILNSYSENELNELVELQKKLAFACDMGYIKSFDELLNEMRRIWELKYLTINK